MMTQLRQRMLEELQRRNYATGTIRLYLQHVGRIRPTFSSLSRSARSRGHSSLPAVSDSGKEASLVQL